MISAFPLQWPTGWKRTTSRKDGRFSKNRGEVSVTEGANRVMRELERMSVNADDVVISTNVQPRLDGMPRAGERKPQDPGAAVYWQERKVFRAGEWFTPPPRVMAIDIYSEVADNLAAIAATLEAMRAIERHGGTAILERAFTGFTALPSPESGRHWRTVLNLPGKIVERSHVERIRIYRTAHSEQIEQLQAQHEADCERIAEAEAALGIFLNSAGRLAARAIPYLENLPADDYEKGELLQAAKNFVARKNGQVENAKAIKWMDEWKARAETAEGACKALTAARDQAVAVIEAAKRMRAGLKVGHSWEEIDTFDAALAVYGFMTEAKKSPID